MGQAYTPGLKVSKEELVRVERRLPLKGKVIVNKDQIVKAEDVVARTELPGDVEIINVANRFGVSAAELPEVMLVKEGDKVKKGQILAETSGFFGFFKNRILAPSDGSIDSISTVTGQVVFRYPPIPVEVKAYIDGQVEEVMEEEGVIVKSVSSFIQGIFGVGGEAVGELKVIASHKGDIIDESKITPELKDKIVVVGAYISYSLVEKAIQVGCRGLIGGGLDDSDLKKFLGYDLGVAITGNEDKGITLIITEGFGKIAMAEKTFNLLKQHEGKRASINGATQIRAGVIRPEIIIPLGKAEVSAEEQSEGKGLAVGGKVRLIREPGFGEIVEVVDLPIQPVVIDTEAKVRAVTVKFGDGKTLTIPRANVELIE
jgi:biotin carboxyl carrier protein